MTSGWLPLPYEAWSATCDTVHAHTQVLGKLAATGPAGTAAAARRAAPQRARGETCRCRRPTAPADWSPPWNCTATTPWLSTPTVEPTASRWPRSPRRRGDRRVVGRSGRPRRLGADRPTPQETPWTVPLDEDYEHRTYDPAGVRLLRGGDPGGARARRVRALSRAFDAGQRVVGIPSTSPSASSRVAPSTRRPTTSSCALGERRADRGGLVARGRPLPARRLLRLRLPGPRRLRHPNPVTVGGALASGPARVHLELDDVRAAPNPHRVALDFGRSAVEHACSVCGWDPDLAASAQGVPPPIV